MRPGDIVRLTGMRTVRLRSSDLARVGSCFAYKDLGLVLDVKLIGDKDRIDDVHHDVHVLTHRGTGWIYAWLLEVVR